MRKICVPLALLFVNACVSGQGQNVWTEQSSQLELSRRPNGFTPPGAQALELRVKRQDLSSEALAELSSLKTIPLDRVSCTEDAAWVRTLKVQDQQGGIQLYYAEDYACPKSEKRQIISSEKFTKLEQLLK